MRLPSQPQTITTTAGAALPSLAVRPDASSHRAFVPRVARAVVHAEHAALPLVGEECAVAASVRSGESSAAEAWAQAGSVRADDSAELLAGDLEPVDPADCWAALPAIEFAPGGLILGEY